MMKTKYLLFTAAFSFILTSCNDFLEPKAQDRLSELVAWQSYENGKLYINSFYGYVGQYGVFGSYFGGGIFTEALTDIAKAGSSVKGTGNANIYAMYPSSINPAQNQLGVWSQAYEQIRRINEFFDGIDKYAKFSDTEKDLLKGQAHFVRAYLYFIIMRGSGSAILRKVITTEKEAARSTPEECWQYIADEFDLAIKNCPESWEYADFGRFTKGAAYAMKSRAMLYAKRWQDAYDAAGEVKKLAKKEIYKLNDSYAKALTSYASGNKEAIWEFNYSRPLSHDYDYKIAPRGDFGGEPFGGQVMPTQELVESYEYKTGGRPDWSAFHAGGAVSESPEYDKLEPRFAATILYNGATWKKRSVETFEGGIDGYSPYPGDGGSNQGKSVTGYYIRKNLNESNTKLVDVPSEQTYVEIRYAEVLLNLAEAAAQLNNPSDAVAALKEVRDRVGLTTDLTLTGTNLLNAIYAERKIELAFEGHRYWDLRRWNLAHTVLSDMRVHGLKIKKDNGSYTYEYITCDDADRQFTEKLYTLPVPPEEIANNKLCGQIDAWK